jgi:hypothetical protein
MRISGWGFGGLGGRNLLLGWRLFSRRSDMNKSHTQDRGHCLRLLPKAIIRRVHYMGLDNLLIWALSYH